MSKDFSPEDLAPLRARVEQIASVVVNGEVDSGMIVGLSEAVTNAADIASQALEGKSNQAPRRHAVAVVIGHTAREIILGIADTSQNWTKSPERPGTIDPDEDLGNFISFSLSQAESNKNLATTGITGRGTRVMVGTAKTITYTKTPEGKTVWASYPHPIVPQAARLARVTRWRHGRDAIRQAARATGASIAQKVSVLLDISR